MAERRFIDSNHAQVRVAKRDDGAVRVEGYAAVFYREGDATTEYQLWEDFFERIGSSAFDRAIKDLHDARALFNHDSNMLLGRVGAKTLRLSVDKIGLRYEIDLPDTTVGRDVATSIERGDLSGSSFAFVPTRRSWVEEESRVTQVIEDVDLYDVGPVTFPAYEGTTTGLRSADSRSEIEAEFRAWKTSHRDDVADVETAFRRTEMDKLKFSV